MSYRVSHFRHAALPSRRRTGLLLRVHLRKLQRAGRTGVPPVWRLAFAAKPTPTRAGRPCSLGPSRSGCNFRRCALLLPLALLLIILPVLPAADYKVAQVGKKNRIVFDYAEESPAPGTNAPAQTTATPAPTSARIPQATPAATPAPQATPQPTPAPAPQATPEPAPAPAQQPTPEWSKPASPLPPNSASADGQAVHNPVLATPAPEPAKSFESPVAAAAPAAVDPEPTPAARELAKPVAQADPAPAAAPAPAKPEPAATGTPIEGALPVASNVVETPDLAPQLDTEPPTPTQSVTINLINKLVQRGILTKEDAKEMITQAQAEAEAARAQSQSDMFAVAQVAAAQAASDQIAVAQAQMAPASPDDVRVTYIPEPVKMQIKEEIKLELAADRASSKWAGNVLIPRWANNVNPFFDLRLRFEGDYFPNGNDATGAFPNFNAINTGAPFDTTGTQFAPQLNVDQNRNQFRLRARFGADINMGENFTSGFRVATGQNNSPVSTNQSLGLANSSTQGQGGSFSKYAIWLDRAFVRYDLPIGDKKFATAWAGRFENPFMSTRLIWDEDLGFDGAALKLQYEILPGLTPFMTAGAFVVYNTDFNFSSNQPAKFQSYDKYLYGIQGGLEWKPTPDWKLKVAAAYYYFHNIEGKLSTPYTPQTSSDASDTDNSRPSFAQKGNTYMAIRNIVPDASNDFGAINQWQYYGLATKFQELAITGRLEYNGFEPVQVSVTGEVVSNLAFNKDDIELIAVNNRGAISDPTELDAIGAFDGSGIGWLVDVRVGTPALAKRWDWQVDVGYRWIGSDAVVDGFNDSDFGLGGTNMKGFTVGAHVSLSENVYVGVRWMGSDNITGPTYKTNIIQLDLNSKF